MTHAHSPAYRRLIELYGDLDAIDSAMSLLNWDRQVLMPPGGSKARGTHVAKLAGMRHRKINSDEFRNALALLESDNDGSEFEMATVRVLQRELKTQSALTEELVARKARVSSDAYEAWRIAKPNGDFNLLKPFLQELFDIAKETATLLGFVDHVYDPLVDLFEEGATYRSTSDMFRILKPALIELLQQIRDHGRSVDDAQLANGFDPERLRQFAQAAATAIGFDFGKGRLDLCTNAFCTHLANCDIRMTTRPSEHIKGVVSSSLHEMGHGLYEQLSPNEFEGTPLAGGISLAVHESQSRLWENIVGRSRGFWEHFLPLLRGSLPEIDLSPNAMYRAMNKVEPSFIRVGADEISYNLHILVRFELEAELLTEALQIKDLPEAWNAKYRDYLGIDPPSDTLGCLQDVHWSRGSVGYFPTYTMGNVISYQLWSQLEADLGGQDKEFSSGRFGATLGWLTEKIYSQGKLKTPKELVTLATGRPMDATSLVKGLTAKYKAIYELP